MRLPQDPAFNGKIRISRRGTFRLEAKDDGQHCEQADQGIELILSNVSRPKTGLECSFNFRQIHRFAFSPPQQFRPLVCAVLLIAFAPTTAWSGQTQLHASVCRVRLNHYTHSRRHQASKVALMWPDAQFCPQTLA
jgi:hypothetical protein